MSLGRTSHLQLALVAALVLGATSAANAQTVSTIFKNGPDSEKKVIVLIGDGYTAADMPTWRTWVQNRVVDGMFAQDSYWRANQTAFNVYRVDVESPESGVTIKRYSQGCGTFNNTSDDVVDASCNSMSALPCYNKQNLLGYIYTGCWGRCWIEGTPVTEPRIKSILDSLVPKRDYEIRILNVLTGESGGCGGGGALVQPSGASWQVLAHETGHMVSNLYDEYGGQGAYTGAAVNDKNCSTKLDNTAVWSSQFSPGIMVPPATVWNPATMSVDSTVGMFTGCSTYDTGIYRPVQNCRMNGNVNQYCPVCRGVLNATLSGFPDVVSDYLYYANVPGVECRGAGTSYTTAASIANPAAASATVLCPARRVMDDAGNFSNVLHGEAFVIDRNATAGADVCCQMFSRQPNGVQVSGSNVCTSGSSASYQRLKLDYPKVIEPFTFAHFAMKCTLPPASGGVASSVVTYRVIQQRY